MEDPQDQLSIAEEAALPTAERLSRLPRQLAGMQLVLEVPKRLIERDEILSAAESIAERPQLCARVLAGALLLCWPSVHRRQGVPRYSGDLLAYGGEVYDFLQGHGATQLDLLRAGGVAVALCRDAAAAQWAAQEAARGNGRAGGGPASGSSSPSSGTTTSPPARSASSSQGSQDS